MKRRAYVKNNYKKDIVSPIMCVIIYIEQKRKKENYEQNTCNP